MNEVTEHYQQQFAKYKNNFPGADIAWLNELRKQGLAQFSLQGIPTRKNEAWKYTSLYSLTQELFDLNDFNNEKATLEKWQAQLIKNKDAYTLIFIDGVFQEQHSIVPENIICKPLAKAIVENSDDVKTFLGKTTRLEQKPFEAMNCALWQNGLYVHVPKNTQLDKPLYFVFITEAGERLQQSRNLIVIDEHSQAEIISHYIGAENEAYFVNTLGEIFLQKNASLTHYNIITESEKSTHIGQINIEQQRDSRFISHSFALNHGIARSDLTVRLQGENAYCELNGLYVPANKQHIDHHTRIEHNQPHCQSRQLYKGIIQDNAHAVFNGQIYVEKGAVKTDSAQSNKNLLLSTSAQVDTKPQLEIYNDDVRCAHGATIGELDEQSLFYLQTRGLDKASAVRMLIDAFANEVIEKVTIAPLKELILSKRR